MIKITRRTLGKGLATGAALGLLDRGSGWAQTSSQPLEQSQWTPLLPGIWKATIGVCEQVTPVRSRLVEPQHDALTQMTNVAAAPIAAPHGRGNVRGTVVSLPLAPYEDIYGFGLQFFSLAQRGKKRIIRVNADPKADSGDTHAPVPFFVSSRGYGVLLDTARYATFYCGNARAKPTEATGEQPGGTVPLYTKSLEENGSSEILAEIPTARGVDVYLFAGPSMLEAVRRYNLFSGGGVLPPEWGLGFWYRTQSNATAPEVLAMADEFRARNIPCDVMGLEAGWQTHAYSCTFAWNKQRFPEPESFVRSLQARDFHVNLWEHAFTNPSSPLFPAMRDLAGDKGVWGGLVPDFQDPRARQVFGDYHGKHLADIGICGFKLDECDNSDYTGGWSFPELSRFPSGIDGEQMHSLFGLRYQKALWDQYRQRNQRTYGLVRSSGALATPYPFVLYSDLYDHRQFVRALVNSGFSGLLWCPEVRDAKSDEDLIRRLQSVIFSPLAMINGWYIKNPPWKQLERRKNNAGDLAPDWQTLESRCREIIGWRMQIVPYLQAAFAQYAKDGTPPFRALALDWPDDRAVTNVDDAWMIGDRMLVAPLFAGEPGRKLTLPAGDWHDLWTGEPHAGGSLLQLDASVRNIPVFVKTNSVLPLAAITNSTAAPERRALAVQVYGDGSLPFTLDLPSGEHLRCAWNPQSNTGKIDSRGWARPFSAATWNHFA